MRPQIVKTISTSVLSIFTSTLMLAQQLGSDSGPPPPNQNLGPELPIDGGIVLLMFVGLIYGVYIVAKRLNTSREHA